jgi:hypothetical protein
MSDWDWKLTDTARRDFDSLDKYGRERIASKLDEIVTDEWRDPPAHLEPLQGAPNQKLRSASVPFDSDVALTGANRFSTSSAFASEAAMPIVVTTTDQAERPEVPPRRALAACDGGHVVEKQRGR